jgi:hypothetical protein
MCVADYRKAERIFLESDKLTARPSASRSDESLVQKLAFVLFANTFHEVAVKVGISYIPSQTLLT